ncbi:MAG: DUF3142 domain-containing protein [Kofleriaceae bacterium]|nr:DUF3142 domain-containing protein [Kofleriaceae bacterium]
MRVAISRDTTPCVVVIVAALVLACAGPAPTPAPNGGPGVATAAPATLHHDAYVWQRAWTPAVRASVAAAPPALSGLRVLALELERDGAAPVVVAVDPASLAAAGRPVTLVVRIDGSRLPGALTLAPALALAARWRAAGVPVRAVEVDHDAATAAVGDYAAWLAAQRPALAAAGLGLSITALPTWAAAPALPALAAGVDEVVVQVHAVRAPVLFAPDQALADLGRMASVLASAAPAPALRVALPTYQVRVGGVVRAADPAAVSTLVRALAVAPVPGLVGVVWFRLPVDGDRDAWSAQTLAAVMAGHAPAPSQAIATLAPAAEAGAARDVVVHNPGLAPAPLPIVHLSGRITAADAIAGYHPAPSSVPSSTALSWAPPRRVLPAGARLTIGWVTGQELHVHVE